MTLTQERHAVLPLSAAPELTRPILLRQKWKPTLFLHWEIDVDAASALMPRGVGPDLFEGRTYVALVITGFDSTSVLGVPIPYLGAFSQVNVRLYTVDRHERHGVLFLRLDAARRVAATAARVLARLPYFWTSIDEQGELSAHAWDIGEPPEAMRIAIHSGPAVITDPLETWLTSRWGMHADFAGRSYWSQVRHEAWTFHGVDLDADTSTLRGLIGIDGLGDMAARPLWGRPVTAAFSVPQLLTTGY